jgi:glycosyltransferase involved in cell wall biosynthesis
MKILYDHQFFSVFPYSGVSRYIYEVIRRLCERSELDISLFMGWHVNRYPFHLVKGKLSRFFSFQRPQFRGASRLFAALDETLFPMFASVARSDLYHQIYYEYFLPSYRGKRIVTVYDMTSEKMPHIYGRLDPHTANNKRLSAGRADRVIAISESTRRDAIEILGVPPEKIDTVHLANSLDFDIIEGSPLGVPYILYVGQRCLHKNFDALFSVYLEEKEVHGNFSLVCFGGVPFTEQEQRAMKERGCAGRCLRVTGDDRTLARYYKWASALVYPSFYEGFGMPLVEAMHYGCPVVASNSSCMPEIVGNAGKLFSPSDAHELTVKLKEVLFDKSVSAACRAAGYEQEKKFSWDRCAAGTLAAYQKALS